MNSKFNQSRSKKPPRLPSRLMSRFIPRPMQEEFFGDLEELFEERNTNNKLWYARLMYWADAFYLLFGFGVSRKVSTQNQVTMFLNHFKIAFRSFSRDRLYASINLFSLSVGMAICIVICQYIEFESSYDRFHAQHGNTYRVILEKSQSGTQAGLDLYITRALAIAAVEDIPEVLQASRLYTPDGGAYATNPETRNSISLEGADMCFVDPEFFAMFDFPLKWADERQLLNEKFKVVITESIAEKHFGFENPVGKTLKIGGGPSSGDYVVSGVLEDLPLNTHLQFDFFFPVENYFEYGWLGAIKRYPYLPSFVTYLQIDPGASPQTVEHKLDELLTKNKERWSYEPFIDETTRLQPVADIHFDRNSYGNADFVAEKGSRSELRIFGLIATLILLVAWTNYVNLSTARSVRRAREVGIRKSIGAYRSQLMGQFLTESLLMNLMAGIAAIAISALVLPCLQRLVGKEIAFSLLSLPAFWWVVLLAILTGSFLSGLYPALVLSRFKSVSMLKNVTTGTTRNKGVRSGLIVFQFIISLLMIGGTYLVCQQVVFMKNKALGMNMEQLLVVKGPKHIEVLDGGPQLTDYSGLQAFNAYSKRTFKTFRERVLTHPTIQSLTGTWMVPGEVYHTLESEVRRLGQPESANWPARMLNAGRGLVETFELELLAGSDFTDALPEDRHIIINEEALKAYGFESAKEAVNEKLMLSGNEATIVGVVGNFHWQSLHERHFPWLFRYTGSTPPYMSFRVTTAELSATLDHIKSAYDEFYPGNPFDSFFMDDRFNLQYQADQQFQNLLFAFTLLAIFIACTGLFALVSYSVSLRVKEIGIRKVLGAGIGNLMVLLSKEYIVLMSIAIVLALPVTWYWGNSWLENYAFRINFSTWFFVLPVIILSLLAMLTVSYRTFVSARANPVDALRNE